MIREALSAAARNASLGGALARAPIARDVVKRVVGGDTIEAALGVAADLADDSFAELYPAGDAKAGAAAMLRLLDRPSHLLRQAALSAAQTRVGTMQQHFERLFALYAGASR